MWIELAEDVRSAHAQPTIEVCSVLESVASASFHGRHVLFADRSTLRWLLTLPLSGPAKAAVNRILTTVAERGSIRDEISCKLIIQAQGAGVCRVAEGDWHAPIESLVGVPFEPGEILAENLRDASALRLAALHFRNRNKRRAFKISLIQHNGGGAEILHCFMQALAERRNFTFAVTDSDKDFPAATSGAPSRGCAAASETATWVSNHFELPCREIENLLPLNLTRDAIENVTADPETLSRVGQIQAVVAQRPDVIAYTDLKSGVLGRAAKDHSRPQRQRYWEEIATTPGCGRVCPDECDNPCTCRILPAVSQHLLEHFLAYCGQLSIHKQVERATTSPNWDSWFSVGRRVFDWGLAEQPIRA